MYIWHVFRFFLAREAKIINLLKESWSGFIKQPKPLILVTAPWVVAVVLLDIGIEAVSGQIGLALLFLMSVISLVLYTMIMFAGLQLLYKNQGIILKITVRKVLIYIMASTYISIATVLGLMLFVIPGLIVVAVSCIVPIYIIKDQQGPIEAVASSASLLNGHIMIIALLLCGVWLLLSAIEYITALALGLILIPELFTSAISLSVALVVGLFTLPFMVNIHSYLEAENNKAMQSTPENAG